MELQSKQNAEELIRFDKKLCVSKAEQNAIELNTDSCNRGEYCLKGEGMYLVAQYENAYKTCLRSKGLE